MAVGAETVTVMDVPAAYLAMCGLATPKARFCAFCPLIAGAAYLSKVQSKAFRQDGSSKPLKALSHEPDAVSFYEHFLFHPVWVSFLLANVI